jgi:site-specific DNA-methyltransferase (adenine-specific)
VRVITVARKPLSESSVAANVLEHGTGALNIDACRVGADVSEMVGRSGTADAGNVILGAGIRNPNGGVWEPSAKGRWPANLILQHLPGCRQTGITTVQSDGHFPASRPCGSRVSGPSGHKGQDDLVERHTRGEAVAVWDCEPGCPTADLDGQSDTVRASRFFKQVGGNECE